MKRYTLPFILILFIIVVVLITNGTKRPTNETYKIGVLLALTGDAAVYGVPAKNMFELAVQEINDAGGVNGTKLELIFEDSKCNGKDAAASAQRLINVEKVKILIGGSCSTESLAAIPIVEQAKAVLFASLSSSPDLTNKSKFFVRNYPSDASQGLVLADVSFTNEGWRKVAFIQEQLDYPLGIYKAFAARFQSLGGTIVKEEFPADATDFRSQLTKLKAQNPDALFIDTQTPAAAERILKQLGDLGWKPRLLVSDAVSGDPKTVENNKTVLEGTLAAEFGIDPNNEKFQHMLQAYKARYGEEPPFQSYAQCEYDAPFIIRDAIEAVGYDGEKIASWLRTVKNWEGASGLVTIGADGDLVGGHQAKIIRNGKVELYSR